jgi:hypothetical protein
MAQQCRDEFSTAPDLVAEVMVARISDRQAVQGKAAHPEMLGRHRDG